MLELENAEKNIQITLTSPELIFLEECVTASLYCSEMENADAMVVSILRKIKQAK